MEIFSSFGIFRNKCGSQNLYGISCSLFYGGFLAVGFGIYPLLEKEGMNPFETVNKFLIYYFFLHLIIRYFIQKMPVMNIRPLLTLPIKRNTIVHFTLGKTALSFFNWIHVFVFVPFSIMLVIYNHSVLNVILWHLGIIGIVYASNFINVLINNKDSYFYPVLIIVVSCAAAHYYKIFDITNYTLPFFKGLYSTYYLFLIPIIVAAVLYYFSFNFFKSNLNLDEGLAVKSDVAKTENFTFLNKFGTLGTFLKNDIKLLKRNKRSKTTLIMSVVFIFYGLLFYTKSIEAYDNPAMQVFAGIFVSGGFLFTFGQFVPSWDSSYYQLMMSQNIQYKEYLSSKWWLMVIATVISTVIASFYIYFGFHIYLLL